ALTAENFVPHPESPLPGARLYRTGDLGRFRPDGAIEFLGRRDGQVKVRGFRVELGEIESAVKEHPAVADATVVDRAAPGTGSRLLFAYLVLRPGAVAEPALREIRETLARRLPAYMVPQAFTVLPALPLSSTGKVDRRALPEPAELAEAPFEAPRGPLEELLAEIWSGLLGGRPVGREDSFFDLGGHSLLATQVISRVRRSLGVELPVRTLFEAPTLRALARAMGEATPPGTLLSTPPVRRGKSEDPPLSF